MGLAGEFFESFASFLNFLGGLDKFLGIETCNIVFFAIGRVAGDQIYHLYLKRRPRGLTSANIFLVDLLKRYKFVKDIAIFTAISSDNDIELVCRVANSAHIVKRDGNFLLYVLKGVLHQFYSRVIGEPVEVLIIYASAEVKAFYEYLVKLPLEVDKVREENG